jgi:CO/xanthine dehydrogenase Mo-binding subunit
MRALEGSVGGVSLKGIGSYRYTPSRDKAFGGGVEHWSPGAAAAEVEIDLETGEVRVLQFAAVADAGKAIHSVSAKRQIEGGAVMGFGIALSEELVYQEGQLQNADAFQYRLPQMGDLPEAYYSGMIENGDGPGPFGAKAMSQTSIPCVAPAIGNAIFDAIAVHVRSTPFTSEKVLRALGKLRP